MEAKEPGGPCATSRLRLHEAQMTSHRALCLAFERGYPWAGTLGLQVRQGLEVVYE